MQSVSIATNPMYINDILYFCLFVAATWWNTCHTLLASLGIDWDTFWFGGEGSGNSSYSQRESVPEPLRRDLATGQMSMEEILRECMFSSDSGRAQFLPPLRFPPYYDQVLVINGYFDSNYHHFLIDSLTRISRHVDFLLANPQVKIHIRYILLNVGACL